MIHKTAKERYEKFMRDFLCLMRHFTQDNLDNFFATANSLVDWIRHDPSLTREQRRAMNLFAAPRGIDWQACNDVANFQKHGNSRGEPHVRSVEVIPNGFAGMVFPSDPTRVYAAGDEIMIDFDGQKEPARGLVIRTARHFHYIFEVAVLPIHERATASANFWNILKAA